MSLRQTFYIFASLLLLSILLTVAQPSWAQNQCSRAHSIVIQQDPENFHISGIVFEPISPCKPWGPQGQYKADIRTEKALVIQNLRGGTAALLTPDFPFRSGLLNYSDSPGNGMTAHLQLGNAYLDYVAGLQKLFNVNKATMSDEVAETIGMYSIVQATFHSRTGFLSVWSEQTNNGELIGFIRVFDGTDYSSLSPQPASWKQYYTPLLPVEFSLEQRGLKTTYFSEKRKLGYHLFEIGKYHVSSDLNPENKIFVKRVLHRFLKENYMKEDYLIFPERVLFIFHVSSALHEKTYRMAYGARKIEDPNLQLKPGEAIMAVDLKTLRERLKD